MWTLRNWHWAEITNTCRDLVIGLRNLIHHYVWITSSCGVELLAAVLKLLPALVPGVTGLLIDVSSLSLYPNVMWQGVLLFDPDHVCVMCVCRQSWPTRMDMHQDIEDSLASSSISHAGGPQSPARSAESLLNGHRSKGLMDLGRRQEATVTDSAQVFIMFHLACAEVIEGFYFD